jgi:hypothetical protein
MDIGLRREKHGLRSTAIVELWDDDDRFVAFLSPSPRRIRLPDRR